MKAFIEPQIGRHVMVWGMLICMSMAVMWRLTDLQILNDDYLQVQGDKRSVRTIPLTPYRGMITDRHGEALAISTPVQSVWVDPSEVSFDTSEWSELCHLLDLKVSDITPKLQSKLNKDFVYLKRQIPPHLADKIKRLKLPGVHLQREYRRYYPMGEVTAHLLGTTNIDQRGMEGLELAFNASLSGKGGHKTILRDRLGRQMEGLRETEQPIPGQGVQLSIDSRIQYLAYKELLKTVKKNKAKSGSIVVLDADTFEVLAMANVPSYNPNLLNKPLDGRIRNRAVTDQFEPGSVMKPFSIIPVLASGKYYPHTLVDTSPGWIKVNNKIVKDVRNFGHLDVGSVIQKSSNVGVTKLVLSLPPQKLYNVLDDLGFGMRTASGFPGEVSGNIQPGGLSNPFALATLAFGYGISATPLQIADAYAILAAQGIKRPISFLKRDTNVSGTQIISPAISEAITSMLVSATSRKGTAHAAQVPGYVVAGKTGTARKLGKSGYEKDSHIALFAGYAPAYNPKVVIAVVIDDPRAGHYYGGQVAAPVFSKVMQGTLRLLDIDPFGYDKPQYFLVKK